MGTDYSVSYLRTSCRACDATSLETYLDLGDQPPSNNFLTAAELPSEPRFPLAVCRCTACGFNQLTYVVAARDLFGDYAYLASQSRPLREHYSQLVSQLVSRFQPGDGSVVVDVGANDGVLLNNYPRSRFVTVGVEPSTAAVHAEAAGHAVVNRFFDTDSAQELVSRFGQATLLTATNVFAHIDDLVGSAAAIARTLAPDGVALLEFSYLCDMVDGLYFDTIYHEHMTYHALTPLLRFFERVGLRVFDAERVNFGASGPALRVFLCHTSAPRPTEARVTTLVDYERAWGLMTAAPFARFADEVHKVRDALWDMIRDLRTRGHQLGAYTAPAKGNTLLNYLKLGPGDLEVVAETNERKIGKLTPGTHIPVVSEEDFLARKLPYALLLSWNYADFFLKNSPFVKAGGRFLVPLPAPHLAP